MTFEQLEYTACPSRLNLVFTYRLFLGLRHYPIPKNYSLDVDFFHDNGDWKYFPEFINTKYYSFFKIIEKSSLFSKFQLYKDTELLGKTQIDKLHGCGTLDCAYNAIDKHFLDL